MGKQARLFFKGDVSKSRLEFLFAGAFATFTSGFAVFIFLFAFFAVLRVLK